jgi:glycerol-3-phosphate dehydrogenase
VGERRFAVRAEGARSVADLLDRRTRIGLVGAERAVAAAVAAAVIRSEE